MTRLIPATQELTAQPANALVRSNGSSRPLPGWLGGWDLNVLSFTHPLGPPDFNIVNAYYLLAETADAWPTMREVADAVGVVLSTVHYRYHELAASGYLPRMGKSGIDELDEMPWRLAQVIVLHEDQPQAPTAPEGPEASQEPEELEKDGNPRFSEPGLRCLRLRVWMVTDWSHTRPNRPKSVKRGGGSESPDPPEILAFSNQP